MIIGLTTSFGYINLLCAVVMAYGLGRVYGKKEAFERERRIRE